MLNTYLTGIDMGSTTAKVAVCDADGKLIFSRYRRHNAKIAETALDILKEAHEELGNIRLQLAVTGSAGMWISEILNIPFVQEVVASAQHIKRTYPEVRTFIEIGGEDSKIVFFNEHFRPDIRMNGSCAGGTGAFIDQMAVLLNVPVFEFNRLAEKSITIYPIASRCGVFAKTDIQALLSRNVSKEDIAASVFHAVALQVVSALARGRDIKPIILFGGGPLSFFPELRKAFIRVLGIEDKGQIIVPDHPEFIPAMGVATANCSEPYLVSIKDILILGENKKLLRRKGEIKRLSPLFEAKEKFEEWLEEHSRDKVPQVDPATVKDKGLFIGIDSGSTTTKLVLVDEEGRFVLGQYLSNKGNPIEAVKTGITALKEKFAELGFMPEILCSVVTGYGEDLIKSAFGLDAGVVETVAHYKAALKFDKDVSFILDIGGQDMKAVYIHQKVISDIQINEACSSGCGSFIETFAGSLGYSVENFAKLACNKNEPFDLGTRCTVFMNSKVKEALREGASISDISGGLAYSVIKNALYKVMKLKDTDILGEKIVAQGGTFRNPAVLRALEILLDKKVIRSDIPELMGAYGAAITALENYQKKPIKSDRFNPFRGQKIKVDFTKKELMCHGCENKCGVLKLTFTNGEHFFTGNRCDRHFSNNPKNKKAGVNLISEKLKLLFDKPVIPKDSPILTYGIPRCLNMFEDFPFWAAFLTKCGFKVVLSSPSSLKLFERGISSVISDNICFPAKVAHGHIFDLSNKKVDRIFYPIVVHEQKEYSDVLNSYNCPVVTGYPDVIRSSIDPEKKFGIPMDSPAVSFRDIELLKKQLHLFFKVYGIKYSTVSKGVGEGLLAHKKFKQKLREMGQSVVDKAKISNRMVVVLAGRPYHIDSLINHGIPELLSSMGVDVISEDAVPLNMDFPLADINVLTQWTYTNRLYAAAKWVRKETGVQMIQLTSFGCGPDAIATDEVRDILNSMGKIHTLIKVDEISNLGAVRIRLRSMLEAVKENTEKEQLFNNVPARSQRIFLPQDRKRTLIAPYFSPFYSPLVPAAFRPLGYNVEILPPQDKASVEFGLKNVNNEICYPAVLIAGDIIKAFKSGRYDPSKTSVLLTQTGGQCRASNYISLLKKALFSAGLIDVPIVAISMDDINYQPGFDIDLKELIKRFVLGSIFSDSLSQMFLSTIVREKEHGIAQRLHSKYLEEMKMGIERADYYYLLRILKEAVMDFNAVKVTDHPILKIGVVGEIFVKYNFFANGNIIDWLTAEGVEVVLPTLQSFFTQRFVNKAFDQRAFFKHSYVDVIKTKLMEIYVNYHLFQVESVMHGFRFYKKPFNLKKLAEITENVVSMANQFGEGWILTADIIAMLEENIGNIVCLQPFGCISNHITGKGMENRLKEMFPHMNLLSLDMDAGVSRVNILNRLQFLVMAGKEEMEYESKVAIIPQVTKSSFISRIYPVNVAFINNYIPPEIEKWKSWVSNLGLWKKANRFIKKF